MLIRLLPTSPHPSVLFNINFDDLPDGLSLPQTWTTHLSNLMHDELPMPRFQHALDKATFLPCIIDEVVFDVPALLVICRFIDGTMEEWKIDLGRLGSKCLKTLESVIDDVCLSTLETERERQREKQREREWEWERERERLRLLQHGSPSSSVKSIKHKKKRSLLMTIVSGLSSLNSIINLSLPSPTIPTVPSPSSPSPSPPLHRSPSNLSLPAFKPVVPPPQDVCPRFLRRRARSSLVDAFRFYVLHELNQRVPQGGYYVWVLHSLLNEARDRREEFLAREREIERERERERERLRLMGPPPPYVGPAPPSPSSASSSSPKGSSSLILFGRRKQKTKSERGPSNEIETFSATTSSEPPTSDDEGEADSMISRGHGRAGSDEADGDSDTVETDTDGSSIQTPTSEHFTLPLPSGLPTTPGSQELPSLVKPHPVSHLTHHLQSYTSSPVPNSTELQIQSLTHLILLHTSHSAHTEHDENNRLDALEIRGRRRAWLNRALCPNGLSPTNPEGGGVCPSSQRMEIGMGAGYSGLGFSVPIRRSALGMWVVNAEDVEFEFEEVLPVIEGINSGQVDAIMLEEEDVQLVGGERFTGYDERNGVESKRFKFPVPSNGAQLFPVNEVEEEEEIESHQPPPRVPSKSPESAENSDDDDIKFTSLNLNQYDDLRELQMDLDIVTGVGFDMMDSSDEEDVDSNPNINLPDGQSQVEGGIPEGGLRVAFDIPRPKALHARSLHLLSGHEQRQKQRQRQRVMGTSCDQEHHVHQYSHPDTLPERCHTPIPQLPSPHASGPVLEPLTTMPASLSASGAAVPSIPVPQPAHFRSTPVASPAYTTSISKMPTSTIPVRSTGKELFDVPLRPPSRATSRDLESPWAGAVSSELNPIPCDVSVNEMGEFVAGIETMATLGADDGEEFTLAMDLPSKLLSRFGGMSFATIGQTKNFKGRARGASRLHGPHVMVEEGMSVVMEE